MRRSDVCLVFTVVFLLVCSSRSAIAQANLVRNWRFVPDQGNMPEDWSQWMHDAGTTTFAVDNETRHNGLRSLRVESSSDKDWSASANPSVAVSVGDVYRLSGWVKCSGAAQGQLSVRTSDGQGNTIDWVAGLVATTDPEWRHLGRNFVVRRGCANVQFRLTGEGKGTVWLAGPQLVRLGNAADPGLRIDSAASNSFGVPLSGFEIHRTGDGVTISTALVRLDFKLQFGFWNAQWPGGSSLTGMSCQAKLSTGEILRSTDYFEHECSAGDVVNISDGFGKGIQLFIHHRRAGKPELRQEFRVYFDKPYFFTRVEIRNATPVSSNNISPVYCDDSSASGGGARLDQGCWLRSLDAQADTSVYSSEFATRSDDFTAIFDNKSRHAFVLGSVTHDLWKTGVTMDDPRPGTIVALRIFGGAAAADLPQIHGYVQGTEVASPLIFVGNFSDWRTGLETYGQANAVLQPPLPWGHGARIGWNSWYAYEISPDYAHCIAVSDYLKTVLEPKGFANEGVVYVELDGGFWRLSEQQLRDFAKHVHANGQKAGMLLTPFVTWSSLNDSVEFPPGRCTYRDLTMKDSNGDPIQVFGVYALDPTHPAVLAAIDENIKCLVEAGFDSLKVDWLVHATVEGTHFEKKITTGMAAYNFGMKHLLADLDPRKIGRSIYIDLGASPRFPDGYGQDGGPGLGSDGDFGTLNWLRSFLNSLNYSWWQAGTIHQDNGSALLSLYKYRDHPVLTDVEVRTRLTALAIAGSGMLESDDLTDSLAQQRVERFLTNPEIMALIRSGRTFRPVEGDIEWAGPYIFVRDDPQARVSYVAAFNSSATETTHTASGLIPRDSKPRQCYTGQYVPCGDAPVQTGGRITCG